MLCTVFVFSHHLWSGGKTYFLQRLTQTYIIIFLTLVTQSLTQTGRRWLGPFQGLFVSEDIHVKAQTSLEEHQRHLFSSEHSVGGLLAPGSGTQPFRPPGPPGWSAFEWRSVALQDGEVCTFILLFLRFCSFQITSVQSKKLYSN